MRPQRGAHFDGGNCCSTYLRVPLKFVSTGEKQLFLKTLFIFNTIAMMQNTFNIPGVGKHYSSQSKLKDSEFKNAMYLNSNKRQ